MKHCDYCDQDIPPGCRRIHADEDECPLKAERPDTLEEKIGRLLMDELRSRKGLGDELDACDFDTQHEIMIALGKIAVHEVDASR